MSDLATMKRHGEALKEVWRRELARAVGRPRSLERPALIESVVLGRLILHWLDALTRFDGDPDDGKNDALDAAIRPLAAELLVGVAHRLRALGLSRADVRRLELGRRRARPSTTTPATEKRLDA